MTPTWSSRRSEASCTEPSSSGSSRRRGSRRSRHAATSESARRIIDAQYIPAGPADPGYLIKIAAEALDDVAATIVEMNATDNPRVQSETFLEAARQLSAGCPDCTPSR